MTESTITFRSKMTRITNKFEHFFIKILSKGEGVHSIFILEKGMQPEKPNKWACEQTITKFGTLEN